MNWIHMIFFSSLLFTAHSICLLVVVHSFESVCILSLLGHTLQHNCLSQFSLLYTRSPRLTVRISFYITYILQSGCEFMKICARNKCFNLTTLSFWSHKWCVRCLKSERRIFTRLAFSFFHLSPCMCLCLCLYLVVHSQFCYP